MKTKTAILLAILLLTFDLGLVRSHAASDAISPWEIALSLTVPGKGGWTTCYTFATTLRQRLTAAGQECHLVIYDWTDETHVQMRHAFIVYRDADGRYWGMDNRAMKPRWMVGTTPAAWAAFWDSQKTVSNVIEETGLPLDGMVAINP